MNRPVTIAGGGLAGLSLGIALARRGVKVTLHEAGVYPRHRVCGEFISGVTDATLEELGIRETLDSAESLTSACWHDASGVLGRMSVRARGLSRWVLDQRLVELFVRQGGELRTNSRVSAGEGVIWAAGRPRVSRGKWVGLKCHISGHALATDLEMHLGSNGYVGLARIEDGKVNVCGLFHADQLGSGKGPDLLRSTLERGGLHSLASRLAGADPSTFCGVAGFSFGFQNGPEFSLGDAASMIPPFTGNGMSMAFESAACALPAALDYAEGRANWQDAAAAVSRSIRRRFQRRMTAARGMHAFLLSPWGTRMASICARRNVLPYSTLLDLVR